MTLYKLGVIIAVVSNSKTKLKPIREMNNAPAILVGFIPLRISMKKIKAKIANIPVLITGTMIEATIVPAISFLFLNSFITKPATTPATVVFNIQARIVPTGLTEKKKEIVLGENKVKIPETSPRNPPTNGPYNTAPKAITIKEKLRLAKPPGITM